MRRAGRVIPAWLTRPCSAAVASRAPHGCPICYGSDMPGISRVTPLRRRQRRRLPVPPELGRPGGRGKTRPRPEHGLPRAGHERYGGFARRTRIRAGDRSRSCAGDLEPMRKRHAEHLEARGSSRYFARAATAAASDGICARRQSVPRESVAAVQFSRDGATALRSARQAVRTDSA